MNKPSIAWVSSVDGGPRRVNHAAAAIEYRNDYNHIIHWSNLSDHLVIIVLEFSYSADIAR